MRAAKKGAHEVGTSPQQCSTHSAAAELLLAVRLITKFPRATLRLRQNHFIAETKVGQFIFNQPVALSHPDSERMKVPNEILREQSTVRFSTI